MLTNTQADDVEAIHLLLKSRKEKVFSAEDIEQMQELTSGAAPIQFHEAASKDEIMFALGYIMAQDPDSSYTLMGLDVAIPSPLKNKMDIHVMKKPKGTRKATRTRKKEFMNPPEDENSEPAETEEKDPIEEIQQGSGRANRGDVETAEKEPIKEAQTGTELEQTSDVPENKMKNVPITDLAEEPTYAAAEETAETPSLVEAEIPEEDAGKGASAETASSNQPNPAPLSFDNLSEDEEDDSISRLTDRERDLYALIEVRAKDVHFPWGTDMLMMRVLGMAEGAKSTEDFAAQLKAYHDGKDPLLYEKCKDHLDEIMKMVKEQEEEEAAIPFV